MPSILSEWKERRKRGEIPPVEEAALRVDGEPERNGENREMILADEESEEERREKRERRDK